MKIWNGHIKSYIDLEKYPVNKATWNHGFTTGLLISLLAYFIGYGVTLI